MTPLNRTDRNNNRRHTNKHNNKSACRLTAAKTAATLRAGRHLVFVVCGGGASYADVTGGGRNVKKTKNKTFNLLNKELYWFLFFYCSSSLNQIFINQKFCQNNAAAAALCLLQRSKLVESTFTLIYLFYFLDKIYPKTSLLQNIL